MGSLLRTPKKKKKKDRKQSPDPKKELNTFLTYKSIRVSIVTKLKIVNYSVGLMVTQWIVPVQSLFLRNWFISKCRTYSSFWFV